VFLGNMDVLFILPSILINLLQRRFPIRSEITYKGAQAFYSTGDFQQ